MWWHCRCTGVRLMYTSVISIAVAFVLALVAPAHAGAPTDALKGHVDQVVKILSDPSLRDRPEVRRAKVRKIAEDIFDYPDTARRALGAHWNGRTPQEREEFSRLFADLLDRSYMSKIELYQGEKVRYTGESIDGDEAVVKTQITTKSGQAVPIDYRRHVKDSSGHGYERVMEGVRVDTKGPTTTNKIA